MMKCHLCERLAHMKCLGWNRSNLDFVSSQSNVLWFCNDCITVVEQCKTPNTPTTADSVASAVSDALDSCFKGVKDEISQTNALIRALSEKLTSNPSSNKRPRDEMLGDTPRSKPVIKLVGGTRETEKFVETVPKPVDKFWIYLSRIAPHVSEDDISLLVQECLPDSHPVVKKLVKKDADLTKLEFVSFKAGVDMQMKNLALDPSVWPQGIYFRAFKDIWGPRPAKFPRTDQPTPS